jgi:hypothetical protein
MKPTRTKELSEDTKVKYAIDFLEELSWLLESKKHLKLSEMPDVLRSRLFASNRMSPAADKYAAPNPNVHYLIGVLPRLFQDIDLFARNDDIADFAEEVLGIDISRVGKRSKYELIGLIVCEASTLDDKKLDDLVKYLSIITGSKNKIELMARERKSIGFSWNETIRRLASDNDA